MENKPYEKWKNKIFIQYIYIYIIVAFCLTSCFLDFNSNKDEQNQKESTETTSTVIPDDVIDLKALSQRERVVLTWINPTSQDIDHYEIYYALSSETNQDNFKNTSVSHNPNKKSSGVIIGNLRQAGEYSFTVKTVSGSGGMSNGAVVTCTPIVETSSNSGGNSSGSSGGNGSNSGSSENGNSGSNSSSESGNSSGENGGSSSGGSGTQLTEHEPMQLVLIVPSTKTNTSLTIDTAIITDIEVVKVVYKKDGSENPKTLLADSDAIDITDIVKTTGKFTITATSEEQGNGTYSIAVLDNAGRRECEQITVDNFDFTPPRWVKKPVGEYNGSTSTITLTWIDPEEDDFDHVSINFTYNDGTQNVTGSTNAITVAKGAQSQSFTGILSSAKYYTYFITSYDTLGNPSNIKKYNIGVGASITNAPEGFVYVAGGEVDCNKTYTPASSIFVYGRSITIDDLFVCDHEVTQGEYERFCYYGKSPTSSAGVGTDFPAYGINWYDAIVYCNLLSMQENLECCYTLKWTEDGVNKHGTDPKNWPNIVTKSQNEEIKYYGPGSRLSTWSNIECDFTKEGYRLPTLAEWEYLARGANKENYNYSGSNEQEEVAWSNSDDKKSHQVKTKDPNTLGIYDMSGNVWEWCWDRAGTIDASTSLYGPVSGDQRVIRGGSYFIGTCTVGNSYSLYPENRKNYANEYTYDYGFRVVRSAQ